MTNKRVLVTGACGKIGRIICSQLEEAYEVFGLDIRPDPNMLSVDGLDLVKADLPELRSRFRGMDTVIHCAHIHIFRQRPCSQEALFDIELNNIRMCFKIYESCAQEGVRRVIVASSNHAADFYEKALLSGKRPPLSPEELPRTTNLYGWAKEAIEQLGFVFALGNKDHQPLSNIQIRIGNPLLKGFSPETPENEKKRRREKAVYISERDLGQLCAKCIEAKDIRDENGVPFQIFYGISNNTEAIWRIDNASRVVGYQPVDTPNT